MAIASQHDVLNPGSESFACLNPGMLKSFSQERLHPVNDSGTRVFHTFEGGWSALLGNIRAKCEGKTRATGENGRLLPTSTLRDLIKTFRYIQSRKIVEYLQDALEDRAINEFTQLSFFLEEN